MKRIALILMFALNAGGCVTATTAQTLSPANLSAAQRAIVERGVRESLKDPMSAKFGMMRAGRKASGTLWVCGMVNAKNSFGGYTGPKAFGGAFTTDGSDFIVAGMDGYTNSAQQLCQMDGLPVH